MNAPGRGPWRVLIADDEPPARRTLGLLLAGEPDFTVSAECEDGAIALEAIARDRPDVVFLDIQMPALTGLDLVWSLGANDAPAVVFVTAFDEFAVRAFDAGAVDYLLKPFSDERFKQCLARVRRTLGERARGRLAGRIIVRDGRRTLVIPWSEIDRVEAEDYYVRIYAGDRRPLLRRSLQSLADELDPVRFARVHRSTIVNVERVRQIAALPSGDAEATLCDGTTVRVSRSYRMALQALVAGQA